MSDDFPVAHDGLEVADEDGRPGEPLYPGEHTVVDRDNEPLTEGEEVQVWFEAWADGHGEETITGNLLVIQPTDPDAVDEEDQGDVFAIPAHQDPTEASRVYRIAGDLSTITAGVVIPRPTYDTEAGELNVTRLVRRRGSREQKLLEVRSLGRQEYWGMERNGEL